MNYYEEHFDEICEIVKEINENCVQLESELFLPYKYRRVNIVLNLIDILVDGKADNWKDLINLYDTHQYRAGVYERLDLINAKLDSIQSTLIAGFSTVINQLNGIQNQLSSIDDKMSSIECDIKKIKKYEFITMWNSL